jgi:hypothetical protein
MGKIVSVYEHFGLRTASRNELNSWTEVPLYIRMVRTVTMFLIYLKLTSWLLDYKSQTPNCQNGKFLSDYISGFTGVRLLPLHPMANFEYFSSCSWGLGNIKQAYHFLCRLRTGHSKLTQSFQEWNSEFYDGRLVLETCTLHFSCNSIGFKPSVTEGWQLSCLIQKYQDCWATINRLC